MDTLRNRVRSTSGTLLGHHQNEIGRIVRAAAAKAYGLNEKEYATPYTQHNVTIVYNEPTQIDDRPATVSENKPATQPTNLTDRTDPTEKSSRWWPWLLSGALAIGGLYALRALLDRPESLERVIDRTKDVQVEYDVTYEPPESNP